MQDLAGRQRLRAMNKASLSKGGTVHRSSPGLFLTVISIAAKPGQGMKIEVNVHVHGKRPEGFPKRFYLQVIKVT